MQDGALKRMVFILLGRPTYRSDVFFLEKRKIRQGNIERTQVICSNDEWRVGETFQTFDLAYRQQRHQKIDRDFNKAQHVGRHAENQALRPGAIGMRRAEQAKSEEAPEEPDVEAFAKRKIESRPVIIVHTVNTDSKA